MKMLLPQQVIHHRVPEGATCLSLYANSSTELEQLVEQARRSARNELSAPEVERLFRPLRRWRFDADSGAFPTGIFITQGFSGCAHLPFKSKGLGVVAKSFHVKPLLKWIQREHPFSLLLLEESQATLFQGSLSHFREEETLPYRELRTMDGVFNALDRAVYRTVQSSRTPLILGGELELVEHYRNVSGYKAIVDDAILFPPPGRSRQALHEAAIGLLEPYLERREDLFLEQYRTAERRGRTAGSLREIVQLALEKRVKLLLVSEGLNIWGKIDQERGTFSYSPQRVLSPEDDVLDDLAEIVVRDHGSVAVLPSEKMPHGHVACAVLKGTGMEMRMKEPEIIRTIDPERSPLAV